MFTKTHIVALEASACSTAAGDVDDGGDGAVGRSHCRMSLNGITPESKDARHYPPKILNSRHKFGANGRELPIYFRRRLSCSAGVLCLPTPILVLITSERCALMTCLTSEVADGSATTKRGTFSCCPEELMVACGSPPVENGASALNFIYIRTKRR